MPLLSPPKWALEKLYTDVAAYFASLSPATGTVVAFGPRKYSEQINQGTGRANRVVILPFDPRSGAGGAITQPSGPGWRQKTSSGELLPYEVDTGDSNTVITGRVRALADWVEQAKVAVWAFDSSAPNDELVQYKALIQLVEWTMRAVHSSGLGNIEWGAVRYTSTVERHFGLEVILDLAVHSPLLDVPPDIGHPSPIVSGQFVHT